MTQNNKEKEKIPFVPRDKEHLGENKKNLHNELIRRWAKAKPKTTQNNTDTEKGNK